MNLDLTLTSELFVVDFVTRSRATMTEKYAVSGIQHKGLVAEWVEGTGFIRKAGSGIYDRRQDLGGIHFVAVSIHSPPFVQHVKDENGTILRTEGKLS